MPNFKDKLETTKIDKKIFSKKIQLPIQKYSSDEDDSDSETHKTENNSKIKRLTPSAKKDIDHKNAARKLAGLPPILVRIRHCLTCGAKFESAGNRTCGCTGRIAGVIAGREII